MSGIHANRDVDIAGRDVNRADGDFNVAGRDVHGAGRDYLGFGNVSVGGNLFIYTNSDHPQSGPEGENNQVRRVEFRPSFDTPPNPRDVLLDFGNPLDDTEPATPEAKVLREILRHGVGEEKTRIVAIHGAAGVGKSCILRGLGDVKVQKKFMLRTHFPDGIYFLTLGMDATESTLIQGLADIAQTCGREELGRQLKNEGSLHLVLQKMKECMMGKKCLVLLEDCWDRNGLGWSAVRELGQIFGEESGSVLVMTTRFIDLAAEGIVVEVEEREAMSEEAEAILLRHAKFEREEIVDEEELEAFCNILKKCRGLPLFLSIVGRGVAELATMLEWEECGRKLVWRKYWEKLQAVGQNELLGTENDGYPNLSKILLLSLELLSKRRGNQLGSISLSKLTFREMHRALCVFKKQARIPISACRRLWNVKHDEAALQIAKCFAGVGLADVESRRLGEKDVEYIRLHDLVHMFAVACASTEKEVAKWHEQLLESYLPKDKNNEVVRKWWNARKDVGGYEYLFENVCRHLINSGNVEEAEGLLVSGEWSKFRHEVGGLSAWKNDFWERLEGGKKDGGSESEKESEKEIEEGLKMVRDAVIDSWRVVHENPGELGFQAFGRLIDCESEVVQAYLRSIEKVECRPWLKPMHRCLELPWKGKMIGEFHLRGYVFDIALHKKSFIAVVGLEKEIVILDLKEMTIIARCAGHTGWVVKVGISSDGKRAFSWSRDGTVRQWDMETGGEHKDEFIQLRDEEIDENDRIRCGTLSPENSFVVTGSERGKIKVWNLCGGERIGRTVDASERVDCIALSPNGRIAAAGLGTGSVLLCDVQMSRPLCGELKGHVDEVTGIAFSADGRLVASCGYDRTVRVWDVQGKTQVGGPLAPRRKGSDLLLRVAFIAESKQIFAAHLDGSISIWGVASGAEIASWRAHAHAVRCIGVTGNVRSPLVVSGSGDGTVRVWGLQATWSEESARIYHKGPVSCIAGSLNASFFVSGSEDKTLRIWNGGDGRPVGEALCGHEDCVTSVDVSPNSQRIVSVSDDRTMRVWDVGSRAQVGDALRGHENAITCVAYSPDGEFVVSGSRDQTVRVWRVIDDCEDAGSVGEPARKCVRVAEPGTDERLPSREAFRLEKTLRHAVLGGEVNSVAVSQDGQRVLSGLWNGDIWVWDVNSGSCIHQKQSDNDVAITSINIFETNKVLTHNMWNQQLRWRLDNDGGLTRIQHTEDETRIPKTQTERQDNSWYVEVLDSGIHKLATVPGHMEITCTYLKEHSVMCIGFVDGRVLLFRIVV